MGAVEEQLAVRFTGVTDTQMAPSLPYGKNKGIMYHNSVLILYSTLLVLS